MATATVLTAAFAQGGRSSRNGDYVIVYLQGCTFVTTAAELLSAQNWARGRVSCGNAVKDRSLFVDRIENVLARNGGGLATRGSRQTLRKIVKDMTANCMILEEWSIPANLHESMEIQRKPAATPIAVKVPPVEIAAPAIMVAAAVAVTVGAAPALAAGVVAVAVAAAATGAWVPPLPKIPA